MEFRAFRNIASLVAAGRWHGRFVHMPTPLAIRQVLAGADAEAMKEWHRRALTAPTMEAIGILAEE